MKDRMKAAFQLIAEDSLEAHQLIFRQLELGNPDLAAKLKPDFEEYLQTEVEMMEDLEGGAYFKEVCRRIPQNLWVYLIRGAVAKIGSFAIELLSEEEKKEMKKEFRKRVEKRMKGEDIN